MELITLTAVPWRVEYLARAVSMSDSEGNLNRVIRIICLDIVGRRLQLIRWDKKFCDFSRIQNNERIGCES